MTAADRRRPPAGTRIGAADRYDREFRERIESITDADFWGALSANARTRPALAAASAGDRDGAWRLLGRLHGRTLASTAEATRAAIVTGHSATVDRQRSARLAAEVHARHFAVWHTQRERFDRVIDFNRRLTSSNQFGFHYLSWLSPYLAEIVLSESQIYRDDLLDILLQYYQQRKDIDSTLSFWSPVYYELGCGAKTSILLRTYSLLCETDAMTTDHREAILKLLLGFARHLYRDQESGLRPGNQQVTGCVALHWLGSAFREFREAPAWRRRADRLLRSHAELDFFADGGHSERSWDYGWIALRGLQEAYDRARLLGVGSDSHKQFWDSFFRRGYAWFGHALGPHGHNLNYNDGTTRQNPAIARGYESLTSEPAVRPGYLYGVDRRRSACLPESGFAFMRDPQDPEDGPYMSINFGPHGGTHTHPGLLDFSIWNRSVPLIEEVGRFGDYSHPLNRLFRSEEAHNQVIIDHVPMDRRTCGQDVRWYSDKTVDMFAAWHAGFPGHRIYRQIVYVKPHFWLIHDVVVAEDAMGIAHSCLHARTPFAVSGDDRATVTGEQGALLQFLGEPARRRLETMTDYDESQSIPTPEAATILDRYPFCENRFRLTATRWNDPGDNRPIHFALVIVPVANGHLPAVEATPLALGETAGARGWTLRVGSHPPCTILSNPLAERLSVGPRSKPSTLAIKWQKGWTRCDGN